MPRVLIPVEHDHSTGRIDGIAEIPEVLIDDDLASLRSALEMLMSIAMITECKCDPR